MIAVFDISFGRDYVYFGQLEDGAKFRFRHPEFSASGVFAKFGKSTAKDLFTSYTVFDIREDVQVYEIFGCTPLNC